MGEGLQGVFHAHRPQGGVLLQKSDPLHEAQDFKGPTSMGLRRLTVQAARDAVDGCEWRTQTGVCAEFLEAAMPKQR